MQTFNYSVRLSVRHLKPLTTQTGPRDQISKNYLDVDRVSRSILRSATSCPRDQKSKPKTIQTLIACQELSKIQTKNNLDVDTACQDLSFDQQPGADRIKQQQEVHTKQAGASTIQLHRSHALRCSSAASTALHIFLEMMLWLTAW